MTSDDITVCTITLADVDWQRAELLERAIESVKAQTVPVHDHLIDRTYPGDFGDLYNRLVRRAETPFVLFLDDDNYLYPEHVEKLLSELDNGDVIYSFEDSGTRQRIDVNGWDQDYIAKLSEHSNWLDTCAIVRRDTFWSVGGFAGRGGTNHKDWDLWKRMVAVGARFRCVPEVTWHYQTYTIDGHVFRDLNGITNQR